MRGHNFQNMKDLALILFGAMMVAYALFKLYCAVVYGSVPVRHQQWIALAEQPGRFAFEVFVSFLVAAIGMLIFALLIEKKRKDREDRIQNQKRDLTVGQIDRPESTSSMIDSDLPLP